MSWWILALILTVPLFFGWAFLHELAHLLAARATTGVVEWAMKLYPHLFKGSLRWAAISYTLERKPRRKEKILISMAPRILDFVAVVAFPWGVLFGGLEAVAWWCIWGAGLVDFVVGSLGFSQHSDLCKAADAAGVNRWLLRITGFLLISASVGISVGMGMLDVLGGMQ